MRVNQRAGPSLRLFTLAPGQPFLAGLARGTLARLGTGEALAAASLGRELWVTDGTASGTSLLRDIHAGVGGSDPGGFAKLLDGRLVFAATDASTGRELWVTDGTAAGTSRLADINSGSGSSDPGRYGAFTALPDGRLVFRAIDASTGAELWVTDGTASGTSRLADINSGGSSSAPYGFAAIVNATPPVLSVSGPSAPIAEGTSGSTPVTFTVTRAGSASGSATVNWAVTGSGANPASAADFAGGTLPSGTVSFAAGETSKTITVNVAGDTTVEADEGFTLTLSAPTGATLGTASASGTIQNDDLPPTTLSIAPLSADKAEGNSGSTPFTFTVTRTGNLAGVSSASWSVGGTETGGNDFAGRVRPSGVVTFAAGVTEQTITVNVAGDNFNEADEGFTVTLTSPVGAALGTASAAGTIRNDDFNTFSIAPLAASVAEGNSGTTAFTFTVSRTGNTGMGASVNFAVTGSGAAPTNAADFSAGALPTGTVNFAAGETSRTLTIQVAGDTVFEANEGFTVTLIASAPHHLGANASATGTILNDEPITLTGTSGADTLAGTDAAERLEGLDANDTLNARLAAAWTARGDTTNSGSVSVLAQGFGADLSAARGGQGWQISNEGSTQAVALTGSRRNDTLTGGAGNDTLTGGAGVDRFSVDAGTDTVTDLGLGADALIVSAGATANAVIAGSFLASALTSNAGVANLTTKGFAVNLAAATGPNGYSVTSAGSGVGVVLTGSAQSDTLTGGSGADTLIGGLGADNLTGGLGADVFRYTTTAEANADVILDFDAAQGDVLDLSRIDANGAAAGNGVFVFLGGGAFSGVAGQLRFAGGQVLGDVNGDGLADFAITLSGVAALSNTNILL